MKIFIFLTILLQLIFFAQVRANDCELTSNDDSIHLTTNEFIQSRQLCSASNLPTKNIRRISISGRLFDYTTGCQKSIGNANIELIHIRSHRQSICSDLYYSDANGYFNLNNLIIGANEEVFLRITAPGYKTIHKKLHVPFLYEGTEETILKNWKIILTVDHTEPKQPTTKDDRMNSIIDTLIANMTLDEKIGQLNLVYVTFNADGPNVDEDLREKIRRGGVGAVLGIYTPKAVRQLQELSINSTRLKVPFIYGFDVIHGHKTIFPIPLGLSASWNMTLVEQSARIAAIEASADALNWVYSPMVDIARDPRWGRVMEGAGEDPWLGSQIAAAMVRGYQGGNLSSIDTVMACVKHYALYGAAEAGRDYNTVDMSLLRMYEVYLPPYRAAVEAGSGSIMTSFNEINGLPSTANQWLVTDLLRQQWNFTGFVVTDYGSIFELVVHGLGNEYEGSVRAINAGVDLDMGSQAYLYNLNSSVQQGRVTVQTIEQACRRVLEAKYKLGLLDDPFHYVNETRAQTEIFTQEHRLIARETARRSFVLLKNDNQVLPLRRSNLTIALVGPLADDQRNVIGGWSGAGDWTQCVSVVQGMIQLVGNTSVEILHAKGSNLLEDPDMLTLLNAFGAYIVLDNRTAEAMIDEAIQVAQRSDIIVAVVGEPQAFTGEAASRADISLPVCQQRLLAALFNLSKPIVLVVMNGRPLTLTWEDQHATAILETWFGGTEAGNAIAEVLFGYYNPAGKLTATFPRSVGQIPLYYNHKNTGRPYSAMYPLDKMRSRYIDMSNEPLYPFGYGLSYTTFSYGPLNANKTELHGDFDRLFIRFNLTNNGSYDGEETVQLYIRDPVASITRAIRELKDYQKVFLHAGERQELSFTVTTDALKFYNATLDYDWEEGVFDIFIGTHSNYTQSVEVNWYKQ